MQIRRPRSLTNRRGFTLIELMIVVVIIGILAALAIPRFGQATARAKEKEADGILKSFYTAQSAYSAKFGVFAANATDLNNQVGWESPPRLEHYAPLAADATFPKTMSKITGRTGYCDRQITVQGELLSLNCN